jgi:hypothetical protein
MAEAQASAQWDHTAALLAMLAEPHRDKKKRSRPFTPADFHPFVKHRKVAPPMFTMSELKPVFMRLIQGAADGKSS